MKILRAVSGRVGRIRKGLLPPFDGGFSDVELDMSEKVFSCPRNPRFVDDEIEYLWREETRHHGLCQRR